MRILVAGGAGMIGSHMCDVLVARGDQVVAIDNLLTGRASNVAHLADHPAFTLVIADVCQPLTVDGHFDAIADLASPASPLDFATLPLEILAVGSVGTTNLLRLAHQHESRFLLASTSEVYGDPLVHPQPETYWGNVNPVGPRSCYDEAKRFAEATTNVFRTHLGVNTAIARIFNTYGPRMRPDDGRVVTNFVMQALRNEPITIYGDGSQTRSFCYVTDEVDGLLALLDSGHPGPMNIGNQGEFTIREFAELVLEVTGSSSELEYRPLPVDDPLQRCPDSTLAESVLGWRPTIPLHEGLIRTAEALRRECTDR